MKKYFLTFSILIAGLLAVTGCTNNDKGSESVAGYSAIQERGVLEVGVEATFPPFTYHDDSDELVGFDVDVARAVAEKLDLDIKFTETKWDSLIAGLDVNHYDVVFSNVAVTDERKEKYDFSEPYAYSRPTIIVQTDNDEIQGFTDLKGKKSAQTITSNYAKVVESYGGEVVGTAGFAESIELVNNGVADATLNDDVIFYDYMKQHPNAKLKIVAEQGDPVATAAIFNQGNPELKAAIDKALAELRADGTLVKISNKYFGSDITNQ